MFELDGMVAIVAEMTDHGLIPMLNSLGVHPLAAQDARQALRLLGEATVDFVFADALLPGVDGVSLLERIGGMHALSVRPGRILTCVSGFPVETTAFPLLARPFSAEALTSAMEAQLPEHRPADEAVVRRIRNLLDRLGVPGHRGRAYLTDAIAAVLNDARLSGRLSQRIYPALARRHGVTAAQVERAIRYCIDAAWKRGSMDEQYRLFGNTIDAQRGKPTVGEMLARTADILRLEESL